MNKFITFVAICGLVTLTGCATQRDVADAKAEALEAASKAQIAADNAMQCCEDNAKRLERMYQKIMSK